MEGFEMNPKRHHKHKQQRQPDAYELYELEHMPHGLTEAPYDRDGPQPRHIPISNDYYKMEVEAQPHWRPLQGANRVIFKPDYYDPVRNVQPYPRSTPRGYEAECEGDVDCMAHRFIELKHEKFEQSKWTSMKK